MGTSSVRGGVLRPGFRCPLFWREGEQASAPESRNNVNRTITIGPRVKESVSRDGDFRCAGSRPKRASGPN